MAVSTAGAAVLYPLFGRRVLGAWAGSVLIDADHYLWYCLHTRSLDPRSAFRYFNAPDAPQHSATRVLHSPLVIASLLLYGVRRRGIGSLAAGMAIHAALDAYHVARLESSRAAALDRDEFTCQKCGDHGPDVVAHLDWQPPLLPSYRKENFVSLCPSCHAAAHSHEPAGRWPALRAVSTLFAALRPAKR